eukprot:1357973-Rhodomonas_salina.1
MLLKTSTKATKDTGSGGAAAKMEFAASLQLMLSGAFDVTVDKVASFKVELQLTETEACLEGYDRVGKLQATLEDYASLTASDHETVQITSLSVDMNRYKCPARRSVRKLLAGFSPAVTTEQMMIVFTDNSEAIFNQEAFSELACVNAIETNPGTVVKTDPTFKAPPSTCSGGSSEDGGSGMNAALIGGIAGGAAGALLLGAGLVLYMRSKQEVVQAVAVQSVDVSTLKAQLAEEV